MKCPCHSGKEYEECCRPYHEGQNPPTPLVLMRSRYSAYALKKVDYIMNTTHPDHPDHQMARALWRRKILKFSEKSAFVGLKILEATDTTVTFTVELVQQRTRRSFTEKSLFTQVDGRWLYVRPL